MVQNDHAIASRSGGLIAAMTGPRILLIDDHAMFRAGLGMVLAMAMPHALLFQAGSVADAIGNAPAEVQVVLLDIKLNGSNGLDGLAHIKRRWPLAAVLMLSSQDTPETMQLALNLGATGFVSKADTAERIVEVVRKVLDGELEQAPRPSGAATNRQLTPRQREVLELLHQGLPNKLIARKLGLSENTVRRHVQDILEFFQVMNRSEAVFAARKLALVG